MSITGQVGHVALAKQTNESTMVDPVANAAQYKAVKITGDSMVASNNPLYTEGEIGTGRDITDGIPGGFAVAGALNGNARARSVALFGQGALGTRTAVAPVAGPPAYVAYDEFTPADTLPSFTMQKRVGTTGNQLLLLQYGGVKVNTFTFSIPSGGLATFSAGLVGMSEERITAGQITPAYPSESDKVLAFHGARVRLADVGTTLTTTHDDPTFQSFEMTVNNNIDSSEFTLRPSRYVRSLTEVTRSIESSMTLVFDNNEKYTRYTYGATAALKPGANLYEGVIEVFLGNWQVAAADSLRTDAPTGAPAEPQAVELLLPRLSFSTFPVALTSGRIVVTTSARALLPETGDIARLRVRPQLAGIDYA